MVGYSQNKNFFTLVDNNDGEWKTLEYQALGTPLCGHAGHGYERECLSLQ